VPTRNRPCASTSRPPWTESSKNPGGQCQPRAATATKAAVDCYQHAGRFLAPGAGPTELTQQWKTFTYCFDRDLYPLSLPSNLTTEQRNNIASSMSTGECPNVVMSPSNGLPAKPFPQNTGVGSCEPATNAGKFAAAIAEAYARWKQHFVQGNRIVAPEQQNVTWR
jgi:hypothetical protein